MRHLSLMAGTVLLQLLGGAEADATTVMVTRTQSPTMVWTTPPGANGGIQTPYSQKFTAYFTGIAQPLSGKIGLGFISGSVGTERHYPLSTAPAVSSIYSALEADTEVFNYTGPAVQELKTDERGRVVPASWATVVAQGGDSTWYGATYTQESIDLTGIKTTTKVAYGTYTGDTSLGQGTSAVTTDSVAAAAADPASVTTVLSTPSTTTTPVAAAAVATTPTVSTTSTTNTLPPGVVLPTTSSTTSSTTLPAGAVVTTTTTDDDAAAAAAAAAKSSTTSTTTTPAGAAAAAAAKQTTSSTTLPAGAAAKQTTASTTSTTPAGAAAAGAAAKPTLSTTILPNGNTQVVTVTAAAAAGAAPLLPGDGAVGGNAGQPGNAAAAAGQAAAGQAAAGQAAAAGNNQ